jgi:outer membrane protein assembly factor BamB
VAAQPLDIALQPAWQVALPPVTAGNDLLATGRPRVGEQRDGLLSYHVAVSQGMVFIHQRGAIRALRLDTGEPVWPLPGAAPADAARAGEIYTWTREPVPDLPAQLAVAGVPRYCVTVAGNRLFARMGNVWTSGGDLPGFPPDQQSFVVGIDLRTQKILFDRIVPDEPGWQFEAAPLANTEHMFVSARRCDPVSSQVSVRAYRLATGQRAWRTDLARAAPITDARVEISHSPLSLDGDTLYYNSNLGVVAALDAADGRLQWVCRYPRRGLRDEDPDREDRHVFRDLTPCLVHQDLIFVAPADADRILALDAATGHVVWTTAAGQAGDAVHLLGVGQGRLLAGGDSLYWIDLSTGAVVGRFPAAVSPGNEFARPSPRGYGRGVLAGSRVYWPTRARLFVFDQQQPRMVRQPIDLAALNLTGGHLVIAGETLLIAAADRLTAWNEIGRVERSTPSAEQPAP